MANDASGPGTDAPAGGFVQLLTPEGERVVREARARLTNSGQR